ncbi:MAG: hypothetical protein RH946_03750 [Rhodospirillales bacterium]
MKGANPLFVVWAGLSTLLGVLALMNSVDYFAPEFWQQRFRDLLFGYQTLIYPVWEFLFFWLPFQVPEVIYDYLTIGCLLECSAIRGHWRYIQRDIDYDNVFFDHRREKKPVWKIALKAAVCTAVWPYRAWLLIRLYYSSRAISRYHHSKMQETTGDFRDVHEADHVWYDFKASACRNSVIWFATMILCLFAVAVVNVGLALNWSAYWD